MLDNNLKGILGLCRRADKMSLGHDASVTAIKQRKAFLAVACSNASERLKREIADECAFEERNIKYTEANFTTDELSLAVGKKVGVFTVDDINFAEKLYGIITAN